MTLAKIIDTLKMIALKHPNVNSAYEGNIYDILNAKPDNRYASVVITQQSHTTDEIYDHYGFVIFYVDRLVDDLEENRVQIQSIGKSMLGNIITAFCNEFEAECDNISYQTFTQRFADETAGVYCTITIDTVKDVYCAERYWDESWLAPTISIRNVDMSITITENGHYEVNYDSAVYTGIGKVDIDVNLDTKPYYNDGYGNGYNDGYNDGYGKGYDGGKQEARETAQEITITENGQYGDGENLYKTINVNVSLAPKISIREYGVKFSQSTFSEVPEWADFEGVTNMEYMFRFCDNLQTLHMINTGSATSMYNMFGSCGKLQTIPNIDTSNVVNMESMFTECGSLQSLPSLNTGNVTNMNSMFYSYGGNKNLISLPKFDCGKLKNIDRYFCLAENGMSGLVDVGGWENLKIDWNDGRGLDRCPNLSRESCINILNGLYDFRGNGDTTTTKTLKVHQNFLDTVGEDITIATDKGWIITA